MGAIKSLTMGAGAVRPFVNAVLGVEKAAREGSAIAVLDGAPGATRRLRSILGVDADEPLRDGNGLLVHAAVAGHDPALAAAVLAGAKREGRRVLAILVGTPAERAALEHAILAEQPLEPSNIAHLADLSNAGPALAGVARALDENAIAAALRYPALRETVADTLVARASRQCGAIAAAPFTKGPDFVAILFVQVRLVAQLAALHGRPLDVRRGLEVVGVVASAFGWREFTRRAIPMTPVAGFAVRAGVSYSATRTLGEAARAYFAEVGDRADMPLDGLQRALQKAMARRGRR